MRDFWDELWRREREFYDSGKPEFRHETPFVSVSSIAGQYYCEFKAENEFAVGEIPTEAKTTGSQAHEDLIPLEAVSEEEFVRRVEGRTPSVGVIHLWGSVAGLKIVGTPDHITWRQGKPIWVVELKTTRSDPSPLWQDQENQVRIYGLLLDLMGFDCSQMKLAVVRLKVGELDERGRQEWTSRVTDALISGKVGEFEAAHKGVAKVHVLDHRRNLAAEAVMAKAGYWLDEREAIPTTSVGRCRACEYNAMCMKSLYRRK